MVEILVEQLRALGAGIERVEQQLGELFAAHGGRGGAAAGTAPIREGDAVPIMMNELQAVANTGAEPLEFLIIGVFRNFNRRVDSVDAKDLAGRKN
jgi:hypothetical protein